MKKYLPITLCVAVLSFLCQVFAQGEKVSFPSFADGHVYGEKISADDLRGKVVFFEYWGIHCPPCRTAMPHLVEMQRKYGSKGFIVIGSHVQMMSPDVAKYCKENKINFPVYSQKHLPQAALQGGIPYSALIGADGRLIAKGHPSQLYGLVEDAVAQAAKGYPILDGVELDKYKSLEKTIVSTGTNVEAKVEGLRKAAEEGDAEAQAICEAYDAWLTTEKARISRLCETNPMQAMKAVSVLRKAVPSVTDFDEQVKSFKENPVYQKVAALQKKVEAQQKREAKGKRVSASALKGLRKSLDELRESEAQGVAAMCDELEASIDALDEAGGSSKKEKKGKKKSRQDSGD